MALDWDDLRFLLAIRREGSLGAAARSLKVEVSTASRRLAALEAAFGVQLAARTPEGLVLNEAGLLASDLAEGVDQGIRELVGRIGGEDLRPEGIVRLGVTESTAKLFMRGLVPLREAHPKIQVELVVGSAPLDIMRREADVAIRFFRETSPTVVARKVGNFGWSVFASRDFVERTGIIPGAGVLLDGHPLVGFKGPTSRSPGASWLAAIAGPERVVLSCDSIAAVANAVEAGLGLSALPCFMAPDYPTLVRLTPEVVAQGEVFVVFPPDHRETVRVRLVVEAIVSLFSRERALVEGTSP